MSVAELKMATREAVGNLEHRYGRKRVYVVGGIILVIFVLLVLRVLPPPIQANAACLRCDQF